MGYVVIDVTTQTKAQAELVLQKLKGLPGTIRALVCCTNIAIFYIKYLKAQ